MRSILSLSTLAYAAALAVPTSLPLPMSLLAGTNLGGKQLARCYKASADGWSFEVCCDMVLLDILNHFSNSLDACLDLNNVVSDFDIIRFRTYCVGFPQHFLN